MLALTKAATSPVGPPPTGLLFAVRKLIWLTIWLVGSLMLLHPRAVLGISLIYNFCDPLVSLLMMLSLVCLDAVRRNWQSRLAPIKIGVLWLSIGLSLGVKEVALPLAVVVLATQLLCFNKCYLG